MLHLLKKIFVGFYWALIGILILLVSFVFWGSNNGWQFNAILTGSMEPVFNVGGLVVVQPVNPKNMKVGDAISFKVPGMNIPVCHRIVDVVDRKGKTYFATKGDANEAADQNLVPLSDVTGKAILHIPYVGRLDEVKKLGAAKISLMGTDLPIGTMLVVAMGFVFIGLTFKDTLESVLRPARSWPKDLRKRQTARVLKRRQAYKIR